MFDRIHIGDANFVPITQNIHKREKLAVFRFDIYRRDFKALPLVHALQYDYSVSQSSMLIH
ncbi:MAG: hypothetical protein KC588_19500, partial [Nitrospira sp.]|nr:hypothetical protein [Nitrospira sp.]